MNSVTQAQIEYISVGANRHTAVADWSQDGILAFGADVNVALWMPTGPTSRGIQALLSGHTDVVKAVKFVPSLGADIAPSYLITGSDDKGLRVWRIDRDLQLSACVQIAEGHTAAVNCISLTKNASDEIIIATGAADATIRIWTFNHASVKCPLQHIQTIKTYPKFFPLCLALSELGSGKGSTSYILAAAGTRNAIHIYTGDTTISTSLSFSPAATLSGHEGWIHSLDISREPRSSSQPPDAPVDLLLASASQDKYIRLWRIHPGESLPPLSTGAESVFLGGARSPANKAHRINDSGAGGCHSITFEALLLGHEDWIYSARWHTHHFTPTTTPPGVAGEEGLEGGSKKEKLQLLSTSADNSLAIWEADPESGIWLSAARLGEISREKGATTATGSTGGFWTGLWSPDGTAVVTLGRTGGWRMWRRSLLSSSGPEDWKQHVAVGGHVKSVTGLSWEREGHYLLSTSHDQTTRLHARCKESDGDGEGGGTDSGGGRYHELARPQIHGYDLNCISILSPTSFVSGADEKLMRVFKMPRMVADLLSHTSNISSLGNERTQQSSITNPSLPPFSSESLPDAASMPALGLSNKATETSSHISDANPTDTVSTTPHHRPPHEDILSRHTLFPETEKLYGHGYEISCLATTTSSSSPSSPSGGGGGHGHGLIASACKATSIEHAVIRLFETDKWTEVRPPLKMHGLTCTRLRFSSAVNADRLLSVGRDRAWGVFERVSSSHSQPSKDKEPTSDAREEAGQSGSGRGDVVVVGGKQQEQEEENRFELKYSNFKAHSRMILDCTWTPSGRSFVTAGRDKTVKFWTLPSPSPSSSSSPSETDVVTVRTIKTESTAVTAVDFLPFTVGGPAKLEVLAIGTEKGKLGVYVVGSENGDFNPEETDIVSVEMETSFNLPKTINQLAWKPSGFGTPELAVAGGDGSLRIISFPGLLDFTLPGLAKPIIETAEVIQGMGSS